MEACIAGEIKRPLKQLDYGNRGYRLWVNVILVDSPPFMHDLRVLSLEGWSNIFGYKSCVCVSIRDNGFLTF